MAASAVLDTNVLVSGLLFPNGLPSRLLDSAIERQFEMVLSDYILEEVDEVLSRIPGVPITTRHAAVKVLMDSCRLVIPAKGAWAVRDPKDLPIVGTAVAGQVDYLVTGDKDLLSLRKVATVLIVTPRSFASIMAVE